MYGFDGTAYHLDLLVSNMSTYTPHDPNLNAISGEFAQINLACNHHVTLRATMRYSCATTQSCRLCDALTGASKAACYTAGCSCFGANITSEAECTDTSRQAAIASYDCSAMDTTVVLPSSAMVAMTVYDFDTGASGDYESRKDKQVSAVILLFPPTIPAQAESSSYCQPFN